MDLFVWEMKSQLLFSPPPSSLSLISWRAADFCLIFSSRSWHTQNKEIKTVTVYTERASRPHADSLGLHFSTDVRIQMWPPTWQVLRLLWSSVWLPGVWAESIQRFWSVIQLLTCCSRASRSTLLLSCCSTSWIWTPQTTTAGQTYFFWGSRTSRNMLPSSVLLSVVKRNI